VVRDALGGNNFDHRPVGIRLDPSSAILTCDHTGNCGPNLIGNLR
jgi:hypothetical protein